MATIGRRSRERLRADLVCDFFMDWRFGLQHVVFRLDGGPLSLFLGALLATLAFQLGFFPEFYLTLAFLEGLAGLSDDSTSFLCDRGLVPERTPRSVNRSRLHFQGELVFEADLCRLSHAASIG